MKYSQAIDTGTWVLPVPAGPVAKIILLDSIESLYSCCFWLRGWKEE